MLFNSYQFLLLFVPAAFMALALVRRLFGNRLLVPCVALVSLGFYALWDWRYLPILLSSVAYNYAMGTALVTDALGTRWRPLLLSVGVAGNLVLLGYFKYAGFFIHNLNGLTGMHLEVLQLALPLGISFFTFTQIEYLVDAYRGDAPKYSLGEYALFVTFFPHLAAGPILRHRDVIPQFRTGLPKALSSEALASGLVFLSIGLFKKVIIADTLAPWVNQVFAQTAPLTLLDSWAGAIAYSFQLYFDFSGYSDMAVGLALMMNVRIPFNFDSPYKAVSISDFWRRWHISLSTFLRDYIYIPLGGSRRGRARTMINLLATFVLGGLWHGAGWTFILWGAWHGALLAVNHAWRWTGRKMSPALARILTLVAVTAGWVMFRSPSVGFALSYLGSMVGLQGLVLPADYSSAVGGLVAFGVRFGDLPALTGPTFAPLTLTLLALLGFVLVLPNTQTLSEMLMESRVRPLFVACVLVSAFLMTGRISQFLYAQF